MANAIMISSQETRGKSGVENAAQSVAAAFSPWICVLYPSMRLPISIYFRVTSGLQRQQILDQKNTVLVWNDHLS